MCSFYSHYLLMSILVESNCRRSELDLIYCQHQVIRRVLLLGVICVAIAIALYGRIDTLSAP
jgi:hypothetical protein